MNICFYGVGGVGGYFGGVVASKCSAGDTIFFVARGSHKDAIGQHGLTLKKDGGNEILVVHPTLCTDRVEELPVCDLIVLSVKSYDLPGALADVVKIMHDTTVILPLLNGVDIYDRIREKITTGIVLPACIYVGTHIESPGVIFQKGGNSRILTGRDPQHPDYYPEATLQLFTDAKVAISWEDDVQGAIWTKFMFVAGFSLVAALYDKSLGQLAEDSFYGGEVKKIMAEIAAIARALRIPLKPDIVSETFLSAKQFAYDTKTSFQRDVVAKGVINEGDMLAGAIIRYGKSLQIPTPATEAIYRRVRKLMMM